MIQVAHITGYNYSTQQEETLYFTSSASLALNGKNYLPFIQSKVTYNEHLFAQGTTNGLGTIGVGNLVLTNTDGGLDYIMTTYAFDGRKIAIYYVDETAPVTDSTTLYFNGIVDHPEPDFDIITFFMKNKMETINVPHLSATFAGTNVGTGGAGGFEGQLTTIGGKIKPATYGRCMSVEGVPVNDFFLVYGFNYDVSGNPKAIYKFYNVYVKGIQYLYCGDYATPALLILAVIPTGYYATCLASGYIRLGSVPANNGSVVADLADAPENGCTAAQVASRIMNSAGLVSGVNYSTTGLNVLDAKNACPTGIYVSDNTSTAGCLNSILSSIGAWMIPDGPGVFQFDIVDTVANMQSGPNGPAYAPVASLVQDIVDPSGTKRIQTDNQSKNIPAYSVTLNHTKVYKTQDSGSLADAVTNSLRTLFGKQFRSSTSANLAIKIPHLLSTTITADTLLNQPIQAAIQNGDFSLDLSGVGAGWTFGNLNGGNGALSQINGGAVLTPTNGGQCFIQQTLAPPNIQPGSWQLMVTIPARATGQIIVAQGAIGLFNQSYTAANNDQDLVIPFTMLGTGTQSITITLQTLDAVTVANFASIVVCQPALPTQPILSGLANGNFDTGLGAWSFSNLSGGSGTNSTSGGVLSMFPAGTAACQISQTITPTAIWPGNWLFGVTIAASSSAAVTISQGATVLRTVPVTAGATTLYLPFTFTAGGTQSLTITIATVDNITTCRVSNVLVCLNHINQTSRAIILNPTFSIPFNTVTNGWKFNATGTASYVQTLGTVTLTNGTGIASISQTITIPDKIQQGNNLLSLQNTGGAGTVLVSVYQGTTQIGTVLIAAGTTGTLPFVLTAFGTASVTFVIQPSSSTCAFTNLQVTGNAQAISPNYAGVINGDFSLSPGNGWTFANQSNGTGTVQFLNDYCIMRPAGNTCSVSQIIPFASIPAGNWTLSVVLASGFSGVITALSGTTQLFSRTYSSATSDQYITIPMVTTGSNVTITLSTKLLNQAKFKNLTIYTYDSTNITKFANLVNGNFANQILNLQAGWIFSNDTGDTGIYAVANNKLTLTPSGVGSQISQNLNIPNGIYEGTWNLTFTVSSSSIAVVSIYQGTTLLATQSCSAFSSADTSFTLPVTILPSSSAAANLSIVFHTSGASVMKLSNVYMSLQTAGLSPLQEATRRLGIESALQERYTLDIPFAIGFKIKPGNMISVQLNRYGMNSGRTFLVIGRDDSPDIESILLDIFRA